MRFATTLVAAGVAGFLAAAATSGAGAPRGAALNPVQVENRRPGTTAWRLAPAPRGVVDAYTSQVSARPGDTVDLHVATSPAATYRVEVYRLGWYGGSGGRLVACIPACDSARRGATGGAPRSDAATGLLRASWPGSDAVRIGAAWVSGYYLLDVVLAGGPAAGTGRSVPLIVREPGGRPSAILAQASVNTWQAYNAWGGTSLYTRPGTREGSRVSFDRPYDLDHQGPAAWELPAVRFLERHGYDVSYTTDVDTDREPGSLLAHALVITLGHDEYWTRTMRDAFEAARDRGVSLAFLGANTGYWQVRYEDDRRTLVEYRRPSLDPEPDPAARTTTFRELSPPRPECTLLGVQYGAIGDSGDYAVNSAALGDSWFLGTGFEPGASLHGLVGYEWDGIQPGCPTPPLTVFFHAERLAGRPPAEGVAWNADAVRYTAPSGARVFSSGSLQFAWGLDPWSERFDTRLDRFLRNGLDDLTRPPPPGAAAAGGSPGRRGVLVRVLGVPTEQVDSIVVFRHRGAAPFRVDAPDVVRSAFPGCGAIVDRPGGGVYRYAVAYATRWRESVPVLTAPVALPAKRPLRGSQTARCVR